MSAGTAQVACGKYKLIHKQNNKLFHSNMLFPKPHIFAYFLFIFYVVLFSLILSFHNKPLSFPPPISIKVYKMDHQVKVLAVQYDNQF